MATKHLLLLGVGFHGVGDITPPGYSSSDIGEQGDTIVAVIFSEPITSDLNDYAAGVTIKRNAVTKTITSAVRQGDNQTVYYTINDTCDGDDDVTWAYVDASGDIRDIAGNQLGDVAATTVTNTIATRWWFNRAQDSSHLLTSGVL